MSNNSIHYDRISRKLGEFCYKSQKTSTDLFLGYSPKYSSPLNYLLIQQKDMPTICTTVFIFTLKCYDIVLPFSYEPICTLATAVTSAA